MKATSMLVLTATLLGACTRPSAESSSSLAPGPSAHATGAAAATAAVALPVASSTASTVASAVGATQHASSLAAARERYRLTEADPSLLATPLSIDCGRSETHASGEVFRKDGVMVRARVKAQPPGDTSMDYAFFYEQGTLAFARYTVTGSAGNYQSISEYQYYYSAGKRVACLKKHAAGSESENSARLSQAAEQEDDCQFAARAFELGSAVVREQRGRAVLIERACAL